MDHAAFHIVYVDKRVSAHLDGQYICPSAPSPSAERDPLGREQQSDSLKQLSSEIPVVRANLNNLLSSFSGGMFRGPRDKSVILVTQYYPQVLFAPCYTPDESEFRRYPANTF